MGRFAHIADAHIGAWREDVLAEINMEAFRQTMERCKEKQVDFIVISGDLFDGNLPDLEEVNEAARILRDVRDAGIPIYVTYGSHDFSPTSTSIIDVLASAGLFTKLSSTEIFLSRDNEPIRAQFFTDEKTGAKLVGVYGRKRGLEREYYELLDKPSLERAKGFKIFVFHSAIEEFVPRNLIFSETIPLSLLPKTFDYYAGGHIHQTICENPSKYGTIAYPGTLFGYKYNDLEELAHEPVRGFFIVDFDNTITNITFEQIVLPDVEMVSYKVDGFSPRKMADILNNFVKSRNVNGKIVLIKMTGILESGKPADIPFNEIKRSLEKKGALIVRINRGGLSGPQPEIGESQGKTREEIEDEVLQNTVALYAPESGGLEDETFHILENGFSGENGVLTAKSLIKVLEDERREDERRSDFDERITRHALPVLGLGVK
jgi:hypothetical protein